MMTRALAFGFAVGFLVVFALVTIISLRSCWPRTRNIPSSSTFCMPRPRALNLHAHFGTLRRISPSRSTLSTSSEESEESYEKSAVKRELSTYAAAPQTQPTSVLSMLAAVPGHILALISSPVPLRSRPVSTPAPPIIHLSFPYERETPRPARALPVIHRRRGAISLVRPPPPPKPVRERPESLQTLESPSMYSQVTPAAPDDVPTIMVSAPSCPTLEPSEVEGREGGLLGPRGHYF